MEVVQHSLREGKEMRCHWGWSENESYKVNERNKRLRSQQTGGIVVILKSQHHRVTVLCFFLPPPTFISFFPSFPETLCPFCSDLRTLWSKLVLRVYFLTFNVNLFYVQAFSVSKTSLQITDFKEEFFFIFYQGHFECVITDC